MNQLPENTYFENTLYTRLGVLQATDIFLRQLDYAICNDLNGDRVSVTRVPTVEFHNDVFLYVVELLD